MTKLRSPMSVQGVILAAFEQLGGTSGAQVVLPHRKLDWLRASTNPDLVGTRHEAKLSYEEARTLTRCGALALAEDLAFLSGHALVPMGDGSVGTSLDLMGSGANLMREAAEAIGLMSEAAADGKITPNERARLEAELLDVIRSAQAALKNLGGGTI